MKRRILIAVFAAIFIMGIIGIFNRTPSVSVGNVTVTNNGKDTVLDGYEVSEYRNGKMTQKNTGFDIKSLAGQVKSFDQNVKKNSGTETVTVATDMAVGFSGRYCDDISYSVYDLDGKVINKEETSLNLPTKNIDGCVVKVDVKWGRDKNYKEYYYFFRINYNEVQ